MEKFNPDGTEEVSLNQPPVSDPSPTRQGNELKSDSCPKKTEESKMNEEFQNVVIDGKQKDKDESKSGRISQSLGNSAYIQETKINEGRNSFENDTRVLCQEMPTDDSSSQSCDLLPGLRYAIPFLSKKLKTSLIQRFQPCSAPSRPSLSSDEDSDEPRGIFSSIFFAKDNNLGNHVETNGLDQDHLCEKNTTIPKTVGHSCESHSDDFEEYPPSAYRLFDEKNDISEVDECSVQNITTDDDKDLKERICEKCEKAKENIEVLNSHEIKCVFCNTCNCHSNTFNHRTFDYFGEISKDVSNDYCISEVPGKCYCCDGPSDCCRGDGCVCEACDCHRIVKSRCELCHSANYDMYRSGSSEQQNHGYSDSEKCRLCDRFQIDRHEIQPGNCCHGDQNMSGPQNCNRVDEQRCRTYNCSHSNGQTCRPYDCCYDSKNKFEPCECTGSNDRLSLCRDCPLSYQHRLADCACRNGNDGKSQSCCHKQCRNSTGRPAIDCTECEVLTHLNTYTGPPRSISDIITDLQQIDLIDCFLSDNECKDDNESAHSSDSFLQAPFSDRSSDNGEADDEFECDCQYCHLMKCRSPTGQNNLQCHATNDVHSNLNWQSVPYAGDDFISSQTDLGVLHNDWVSESDEEQYRYDGSSEPLEEFVYDIQQEMEEGFERMIREMLLLHPELLADTAPPPAAGDVIESLPKIPASPSLIDEDHSCPICMGAFVLEEIISTLPCGHIFHHACVKAWLNKSGTCPVCRRRI